MNQSNRFYDHVIETISSYVCRGNGYSDLAMKTSSLCLMDSIGCALLALKFPNCFKRLGPSIPGTVVPNGTKIIGTNFRVDPIKGALDLGSMIRWLDYNDTWLGKEWGHPSDNFGALLAVTDYLSRNRSNDFDVSVKDLLSAAIKAYEIQGILALGNSLNRVGIDHVLFLKIASTAVVTRLLGGNFDQVCAAISNAWSDATLRTYRHYPNTGFRKAWAAGDATSRAVTLSYMTMNGEEGYPTVLSADVWGFEDTWMDKKIIVLERELSSYVMENILFKIKFPAEFHAQTAAELAIKLHETVANRIQEIERIEIGTQESALRIIDKQGPLNNAADRDHCIQYITAVALLKGSLKYEDYEDKNSRDGRIDFIRSKIILFEDLDFSSAYLDPEKRSVGNSIKIFFKDGTSTDKVSLDYPIGHKFRRSEGIPLLFDKFINNCGTVIGRDKTEYITELFKNQEKLENLRVSELVDLLCL